MAAGDRIFACTGFSHGGAAKTSVTHAIIRPLAKDVGDPGGAGEAGMGERQVVDRNVEVDVFGLNYAEIVALVGAAKGSAVISTKGSGGAAEAITITNVYFYEVLSEMPVQAKDAGDRVPTIGVRGRAQWGSADTFATVITAA